MASENIKELNDANFDNALKEGGNKPLVVDFWAPWCGPCKALAPILEDLANEFGEKAQICKLNVDDNVEIAGKFQIRAIPTIGIFKGGKLVDQIVGLATKTDLKIKIEAHC